jgi:putative ABC transport system ATP-binding protein
MPITPAWPADLRNPPGPLADATEVAAGLYDAVKLHGAGETAVRALDDVTVELPAGRFTAVMGPSGSGKTTLLQCLAGLDDLTAGRAVVGGHDLSALPDKALTALRRDRIGFVFQAFNLLPSLTARENVLLPSLLGAPTPDPAWFAAVLGAVGLGDRLAHRPAQLSGGQQQRVAVARALITRPDVVFADEPTGNLDSHAAGEVLSFLRTAVDQLGQTVVLVTHDPVAAAHADQALFLADGRVVDHLAGPTADKVLDRMKQIGA